MYAVDIYEASYKARLRAGLGLLSALIFGLGLLLLTYQPVNPGDPLDYVLFLADGTRNFQYLDRLNIYVTSLLLFEAGVPIQHIPPVMATLLSFALIFTASTWLAVKINLGAVWVFLSLMLVSPFWSPVFSFLYPTLATAFLSLASILLFIRARIMGKNFFWVGYLVGWSILWKIQSLGLAIGICICVFLLEPKSNRKLISGTIVLGALLGFVSNIGLWVFLVSPEVAFQNLASYFDTAFHAQVKGRDERGLPLFAIFLFEPSFFLAMTACVWVLFDKKLSAYKPLAVVSVSQFCFLNLLYLITLRGGPPIANYVLDTLSTAFLLIPVLFLRIFDLAGAENSRNAEGAFSLFWMFGAVSLLVSLIVFAGFFVLIDEPSLYLSVRSMSFTSAFDFIINGFCFAALVSILVFLLFEGKYNNRVLWRFSLFLVMSCVVGNSYKAAADLQFRARESQHYNTVLAVIENETPDIVRVDLGRGEPEATNLLTKLLKGVSPEIQFRLPCVGEKCDIRSGQSKLYVYTDPKTALGKFALLPGERSVKSVAGTDIYYEKRIAP